jgi:Ca2+-binding RTX toxin-like protein
MVTAIATTDWKFGYAMSDNDAANPGEEFTLAGQWKYDFFDQVANSYMGFSVIGNPNATHARAYYFVDFLGNRNVYQVDYYDLKGGNVVLQVWDNFGGISLPFAVWQNGEQPYIPPSFSNGGDDDIEGANLADQLFGGDGNDILTGYAGNDALFGGNHADTLSGGDGDDLIDGGPGGDTDTVYLAGFAVDYTFKGTAGNFTAERAGYTDTIRNVEAVLFLGDGNLLSTNALNFFTPPPPPPPPPAQFVFTGTGGRNVLIGNDLDNEMFGFAGNDVLNGGAGDDDIHGGVGRDVLTGGADFDTFFLDTRIGKSQQDVLTDFNRFEDTIALSRTYFRKLGGSVGTSELRFGTEAKDKNDYLIYNKKNGNLYYDPDGDGDKGQILIAQLANKATIRAADFDIV